MNTQSVSENTAANVRRLSALVALEAEARHEFLTRDAEYHEAISDLPPKAVEQLAAGDVTPLGEIGRMIAARDEKRKASAQALKVLRGTAAEVAASVAGAAMGLVSRWETLVRQLDEVVSREIEAKLLASGMFSDRERLKRVVRETDGWLRHLADRSAFNPPTASFRWERWKGEDGVMFDRLRDPELQCKHVLDSYNLAAEAVQAVEMALEVRAQQRRKA